MPPYKALFFYMNTFYENLAEQIWVWGSEEDGKESLASTFCWAERAVEALPYKVFWGSWSHFLLFRFTRTSFYGGKKKKKKSLAYMSCNFLYILGPRIYSSSCPYIIVILNWHFCLKMKNSTYIKTIFFSSCD